METERVREFVQQVWDSTSRDDANVWVGGYDEEIELCGNRAGLLRLAAECLAATYSNADPSYLFKLTTLAPFPVLVNRISLEEQPPEPPKPLSRLARLRNGATAIGCLIVFVVGAIFAAMGFFGLIHAIFTR